MEAIRVPVEKEAKKRKRMDEIKSSWLATVNSQSLTRAFLRLGL